MFSSQSLSLKAVGEPDDFDEQPVDEADAASLRDFRLSLAYETKVENKFAIRNNELMHSAEPWEPLDFGERTLNRRNINFVLTVRSGSLNHKNKDNRTNYPAKGVAIVKFPGLGNEIISDAACWRRLDDGTRAWYDHHKGDITSADAIMDMVPPALFARNEAVQIEYLHQRIRRFVHGRSLQARKVDVCGLNAWWISDRAEAQQRSWWADNEQAPPKAEKDKQADDNAGNEEAGRKRRHSAWNMFVGEASGVGSVSKLPKTSPTTKIDG